MTGRNTAGVGACARLGSGSVLEPRCCTNDVVGGAQCLRDGSARLVLPRNCVDSLEEEQLAARARVELSRLKKTKTRSKMHAWPPVCYLPPQVKINKLFPNLTYFLRKTLTK